MRGTAESKLSERIVALVLVYFKVNLHCETPAAALFLA
jgi:hypothetical protein